MALPHATGRRVLVALVVSVLVVLSVSPLLLFGTEPGTSDLLWCFAGAFASTVILASPTGLDYVSALLRSYAILSCTFAVIGIADAFDSTRSSDGPRSLPPMSMALFRMLITVWWLPFATAGAIVVTMRVTGSSDPSIEEQCAVLDPWKRDRSDGGSSSRG
jgi:hypothetical protein